MNVSKVRANSASKVELGKTAKAHWNPNADQSVEFLKAARNLFEKYDEDKDGRLDATNLSFFLRDLGHEKSNEVVASLKMPAKGTIAFNELLGLVPLQPNSKTKKEISELLSMAAANKKNISDEKIMRARALFSKYDKDGDGSLGTDELNALFKELGVTPSPDLMKKVDPDGNGNVTFVEFVSAYDIWAEILPAQNSSHEFQQRGPKVKLTQEQMNKARETFGKYDIDKDGTVSSEELFSILKTLLSGLCKEEEANDKAKQLMAIIDADGDGNITFIEFVKGYEFWSQVEAAAQAKKDMSAELSELQKNLQETTSRRKIVDQDCNKIKDEVSRLQSYLSEVSKARLNLEKELTAKMDKLTYANQQSANTDKLQVAYDELSALSLLKLKSQEFYCRMQAFLANHTLKQFPT